MSTEGIKVITPVRTHLQYRQNHRRNQSKLKGVDQIGTAAGGRFEKIMKEAMGK